MAGFGAKGVKSITFGFATSKRHILARNRVFWRILRQNPCGSLGCRRFEEPPKKRTNSRVNNLMREIAHAQKRSPLSDLDEILQDGRYAPPNHVGQFWWRSVKGFRGGGGVKVWPFLLTLIVVLTSYNTLALPCECVIIIRKKCKI